MTRNIKQSINGKLKNDDFEKSRHCIPGFGVDLFTDIPNVKFEFTKKKIGVDNALKVYVKCRIVVT